VGSKNQQRTFLRLCRSELTFLKIVDPVSARARFQRLNSLRASFGGRKLNPRAVFVHATAGFEGFPVLVASE